MKKLDFVSNCPLNLEDKVKIILLEEPLTLSESNYTVSDILTTYSLKTGDILKFKIVLKDENGRDLSPRKISSIMPIEKEMTNVRISKMTRDYNIDC